MTSLPLATAPQASPGPSPLEELAAALVHLKAGAVEGRVQEGRAVDLGPPGHVEDPCAGRAVSEPCCSAHPTPAAPRDRRTDQGP